MLKKYSSIWMIGIAMSILIGHDIVPHHHHIFDHHTSKHPVSKHHHGDDHHHHHGEESKEQDETSDLGNLFSNLLHGYDGVTFLNSYHFNKTIVKQFSPEITLFTETYIIQQIRITVRQHSPPYKTVYRNFRYLFPSGLRAPPAFIV